MSATKFGAILAAGALVAAGAFGMPSAAEAKGPPGTPGSVVPGKPGNQTIVEIALAVNGDTGEFTYLLAAVGCLTNPDDGSNPIVDALNGDDRLTLFAPTDEAFADLQAALGIDPPSPDATCALGDVVVADVLTYHVTEGRRFSNSLFNPMRSKRVEMLNGEFITTNPDLTITDAAGQTVGVVPDAVNINASNGVIHVIDNVLLPFDPSATDD